MKTRAVAVVGVVAVLGLAIIAVAADTAESNLVQNPSFEAPVAPEAIPTNTWDALPDSWDIFASHQPKVSLARGVSHQGDQALKLIAEGQRNGNVGVFQVVPVEAGQDYSFKADLMNDAIDSLKGSAYGELSIEWYDNDGAEVARVRSKSFGPALSKKEWQTEGVKGKAPANAASGRLVVTLFDGPNASKGSMWIDNVQFTKAAE